MSQTTRARFIAALLLPLLLAQAPASAATPLADQPLFTTKVPGNLALALSVEYPTAVSVAHRDSTYVPASTYLGYFDPAKCYLYKFVDVETTTSMSHFAPAGLASAHTCTGANDHLWSGNFLNWATMQTIDPFRWAMTGGYRVVDTADLTLLEKAWASGQGGTGNFPDRVTSSATDIAGATPFRGTAAMTTYIQGRGQLLGMAVEGTGGTGGLIGTYFSGTNLDYGGATPVLTRAEAVNFNWGTSSPLPSVVPSDNFSVRWVSSDVVATTGNYRFQTLSDDGVRLWVNGVLVIDNWTDHGPTTDTSANIALTAGSALNVRLEYYEKGGGAVAVLNWQPPGATAFSVYTGRGWPYFPVRVKVCDPNAPGGVESNCKAYPAGNYKPEGLMQQYAGKLRYSVFGYLNDSNLLRDGGVLRARQKFIGPTYPTSQGSEAGNGASEWDSNNGVQKLNPDATDAQATATALGITIANSGALNYVNKFGEIARGGYKTYDPVGELYYAAIRYYKNQGNVAAWTDMSSASTSTRSVWADGFPVITQWNDPIQYSCQRNFVLGIGDVNTHADRNVAGGTVTGSEPARPPEVVADTTVNAVAATDKVGQLHGLGTGFGSRLNYPNNCCNNNSALMAGLAYDSNTRDIRPDLPNPSGSIGQTVQTFWVDVLEYQYYAPSNQFYLAAKYGGFKVPTGFDPYARTTDLPQDWWSTSGDLVGSQPRPDNYFTAGRPDQMVGGLTTAFATIAAQLRAYTASYATALPQVATSGGASYSVQFDAGSWTGELTASTSGYDATTGEPTLQSAWKFSEKLAAQLAGTGWDTDRRVATWDTTSRIGAAFRLASLPGAQRALLDPVYRDGDDSADYLNYLRGQRLHEENSSAAGSSHAYRQRGSLLGDIVNSRPRVVGAPAASYSSGANPGYGQFKADYASRKTVVYFGSNDGMLHAVDGALSGATAGREIFAYVPGALYAGPSGQPRTDGLQSVGDPDFTHHYFVDATPTVFDIDLGRTVGGSGTQWRSVLVGGLGKGGRSYYAIDVTDPAAMSSEAAVAGKVMWEFQDADLGYTYGEPVAVKTRKHGWVLVFGSGYNSSSGKGYFYFVNPRTGALLEKVATGAGGSGSDAGMAHVQAYVPDRTDNTAESLYAGDLLGNLWRLDVTAASGSYPAPVQIARLTDSAAQALPVTSRPLVVIQPGSKRRWVTVGTGRLLDGSDTSSSQGQRLYAIIDGTETAFNTAARLPSGITFPIVTSNLRQLTDLTQRVTLNLATQIGWYVDLGTQAGQGWRVVTEPTSFYGTVTFNAMLPGGDVCNASGSSRAYAIDLGTGQSQLTDSNGATVAYSSVLDGVITDLRYYSVGGVPRLVACNDKGACKTLQQPRTASGLRRLNWRELLLAD